MKVLLIAAGVFGLAPLELADGAGFYLGAWYDRLNGDTPTNVNQRLNFKPMPFFQADCNITATLQADAIDQFVQQVKDTKSDAFLYLTVYPYDGFAAVSDKAFNDFVTKIASIVNSGTKVLIRYASEMNGSWFRYGQQPTAFKREWIRLVNATRQACKHNAQNLAFLWSPNNGNGYPFVGYGIVKINPADVPSMDTNNDGRVGAGDDPYTPYYPGDDYVDWVGISIYHYSNEFPYGKNDIPAPDKFETQLIGQVAGTAAAARFNVYDMFSGSGAGGKPVSLSSGGKPFFVSETAATVFTGVKNAAGVWSAPTGTDPQTRADIRQAWWRQFLDPSFLAKYPKLKAASFFEFTKHEDSEFRDFNTLGWATNQTVPDIGGISQQNDSLTVDRLRADLAGDYGKTLIWAKVSDGAPPNGAGTGTGSGTPAGKSSAQANLVTVLVQAIIPVLAMFY